MEVFDRKMMFGVLSSMCCEVPQKAAFAFQIREDQGTGKCSQRVVDYIVHLCNAKAEAVLYEFNADTQRSKDDGQYNDFSGSEPAFWHYCTAQQTSRVEEYGIHEICTVNFM